MKLEHKLLHFRSYYLSFISILTLFFAAFLNASSIIEYHETRREIDKQYHDAQWAKELVVDLAITGQLSNVGNYLEDTRKRITISSQSGVITINIFGGPYTDGKTLKLMPAVVRSGVFYSLEDYLNTKGRPERLMFSWACTSSRVRSRDPYVEANIGTLDVEFAPVDCRRGGWRNFVSELEWKAGFYPKFSR